MSYSSLLQNIDLNAPTRPLNRYFLAGIGSCHAYLTLREDWRDHARLVQKEIGFQSVRTHGIFHDLVGIYQAWPETRYNFQNLDKIYDFWLSQGLKPYVELSFMPLALSSGPETIFLYRANISPPKDMAAWNGLIHAFVLHLIDRYGLAEVLTWRFEVWNEPDLRPWFFTGDQSAYFDLYANTARTIKEIDSRLMVGGPATSKNLWIQEIIDYCVENEVPIDFVSTHHYCADAALVMGKFTEEITWRGQKAMRDDVRRTVKTVRSSRLPHLEVHYTEWNVSPIHEDRFGKDSEFTATFVLQSIRDIEGLVDRYMLWAISDVFEESGPGVGPFSGKYGLVNLHGIPKPVFHAFHYLSRLYDEVLPSQESAYITRSASGDLRILAWNYVDPEHVDFRGGEYKVPQTEKCETLTISPSHGRVRCRAWQVDKGRGNAYRAWQEMGSPEYLLPQQVEALKLAAQPELTRDEIIDSSGELLLSHNLPPNGLIFYEIEQV